MAYIQWLELFQIIHKIGAKVFSLFLFHKFQAKKYRREIHHSVIQQILTLSVDVYAIFHFPAIDMILACAPVKEGCFKHSESDEYLLHSDKSEHTGESFHSGKNVDWSNFEAYLKE